MSYGIGARFRIAALGGLIVLLSSTRCFAIAFGQSDTFQDGSTMSWQEGTPSPNPPTNVATGGPDGADDRYLQNISSGFSAGSRMIMFNTAQWTGNYNAAGVDRITMHLANFGTTTLHMRIAIRSAGGTFYGSSSAAVLPADGIWRLIDFDLSESAMTNMGGPETFAQVLGSVVEVRLLSAIGGAAFIGDPIEGTLGADNITAASPVITEFIFADGMPRVSFTTVAGRSYRVERKDALTEADWIPLDNATNVSGTGSVVQVSDTEPGAGSLPMRYYRATLLP